MSTRPLRTSYAQTTNLTSILFPPTEPPFNTPKTMMQQTYFRKKRRSTSNKFSALFSTTTKQWIQQCSRHSVLLHPPQPNPLRKPWQTSYYSLTMQRAIKTPSLPIKQATVQSMYASFGYSTDFLKRKTARSDNDLIRKL